MTEETKDPITEGTEATQTEDAKTPSKSAATRKTKKPKTEEAPKGESALEGVGKAAIASHNLDKVFVTSDGAAFPLECDAKNHAANLQDKNIIKVTK